MPKVTLRQIAQRVGCSRSTVSYALKNNPNISEKMREDVMRVARELGWKPDAALTQQMALVRNSVLKDDLPNLALVINKSREELARESSPRAHLLGARRQGLRLGYHVDLFNLAEDPVSAPRLRDILHARGVEGVIFIATMNPELKLEYFEIGRDFACSVAGIRYPEIPFHVAISDFLADFHLCYQKLAESGYKRPGAILPAGIDATLSFAYTGGVASGAMLFSESDRLPICYAGNTNFLPEDTFGQIATYLKTHRPDVVLTTDFESVRKIYTRFLGDRYGGPPIYSLDWFPDNDVDGGLFAQQDQVGVAAVDLVIGQLYRGETGVPEVQRSMNIEGIWVDRNNWDSVSRRLAETAPEEMAEVESSS